MRLAVYDQKLVRQRSVEIDGFQYCLWHIKKSIQKVVALLSESKSAKPILTLKDFPKYHEVITRCVSCCSSRLMFYEVEALQKSSLCQNLLANFTLLLSRICHYHQRHGTSKICREE
mmetsp:Transcript_13861/g.35916  ORF Transcript_13861/g.35916 Transcript_13861/m.35916 type:complete len:117 (+) Transcript_13861:122-472(+)